MSTSLKHGNFTTLAANYHWRPGYSQHLLDAIARWHDKPVASLNVADVGAGTGKLTQHLETMGFASLVAVEPNDAMRDEGKKFTTGIEWLNGSGEQTGLPTGSIDWLLMASSFHWVDLEKGLREFHRVLRPGGLLTILWNPRDLERAPLQAKIDANIKQIVPELKRVSSGGANTTKDWASLLPSTGEFKNVLFTEARHEELMEPERYMGIWRSVNDIPVQAGPERWQQILQMIEAEIAGLDVIPSAYVTRAWTASRVD